MNTTSTSPLPGRLLLQALALDLGDIEAQVCAVLTGKVPVGDLEETRIGLAEVQEEVRKALDALSPASHPACDDPLCEVHRDPGGPEDRLTQHERFQAILKRCVRVGRDPEVRAFLRGLPSGEFHHDGWAYILGFEGPQRKEVVVVRRSLCTGRGGPVCQPGYSCGGPGCPVHTRDCGDPSCEVHGEAATARGEAWHRDRRPSPSHTVVPVPHPAQRPDGAHAALGFSDADSIDADYLPGEIPAVVSEAIDKAVSA